MSTTDSEAKLGHPFAGMTDADGNAIPGDGETDEETEGLHAVADDIEKLQAAAESLPAEPPRLDGEDGEGEPTSAGGENLFNPRAYDDPALQLPMVDGQGIDKIALKFSGTIRLDRSKPDDVALFRRLKLGKDIDVKLEGKVVGSNTTGATNKDGDLDVVVGSKTLDIHTIYPLSIED
jgi:hypothetical protein